MSVVPAATLASRPALEQDSTFASFKVIAAVVVQRAAIERDVIGGECRRHRAGLRDSTDRHPAPGAPLPMDHLPVKALLLPAIVVGFPKFQAATPARFADRVVAPFTALTVPPLVVTTMLPAACKMPNPRAAPCPVQREIGDGDRAAGVPLAEQRPPVIFNEFPPNANRPPAAGVPAQVIQSFATSRPGQEWPHFTARRIEGTRTDHRCWWVSPSRSEKIRASSAFASNSPRESATLLIRTSAYSLLALLSALHRTPQPVVHVFDVGQ